MLPSGWQQQRRLRVEGEGEGELVGAEQVLSAEKRGHGKEQHTNDDSSESGYDCIDGCSVHALVK